MRNRLVLLRERMKKYGIDLYLVPTTDSHGSEYVNDYFKCREYVSGFTGSAGTLVVTQDFAGLWTDGRYFIQAEQQLSGSGIELMKIGEADVLDIESYIKSQSKDTVVGFDGKIICCKLGESIASDFEVVYDIDLVGEIWEKRPELIPSEIYELPISVTGESAEKKMNRVRHEMGDNDYLLVSKLEDIAWLYNLRGNDVAHTPVFYGFALLSKQEDTLYVMDESYIRNKKCENVDCASASGKEIIENSVKKYEEIFSDLKSLRNCSIMLDEDSASFAVRQALDESVDVTLCSSPVEKLKAIKNETEIAASRDAHIRDGIAMVNFIYWLKENIGKVKITEITAAHKLWQDRMAQKALDVSFATIAGYEEHGAIVHYEATKESDAELGAKGFLLLDSGGQYHDGTTDITRTIALGEIDDMRKEHYTAVLKGHIALANAKFTEKTTGADLDELAREHVKNIGFDYNHGTGHGVGHILGVHEGPHTISPRGKACHILPGTITSDEPGIYIEGRYGIRIENELLCIKRDGKLIFEPMTLCPYEREAIDVDLLTAEEKRYIDEYHERVYRELAEMLSKEAKDWLKEQCKPLD